MGLKKLFLGLAVLALAVWFSTPVAEGRKPNPSTVTFDGIDFPAPVSRSAERGSAGPIAHGTSDNVRKRCLRGRTVLIRYKGDVFMRRGGIPDESVIGSAKTNRKGDWAAGLTFFDTGRYRAVLQGRKLHNRRGFCARATDDFVYSGGMDG